MSIKLEAGQWYRNRDGEICYCIGNSKAMSDQSDHWFVETETAYCETFHTDGSFLGNTENKRDLIEHLPDCTGFDWEPPKPIEPPEGWRLLTDDDEITVDDLWLDTDRKWRNFTFMSSDICGSKWNQDRHPFMARKIEPKYRPFANDQEAFPHCDEWLVNESNHKLRVGRVNKSGIATYDGYFDFEHAFFKYKKLDGTPFGVRVDE